MTEQKHQRRRRFELEPDELYQNLCRQRNVDNRGDEDSLLFGDVELDDRDQLSGWGVSAAWMEEMNASGQWSVFVDYESFQYLREQEEKEIRAEDAVARYEWQVTAVEDKLQELRCEARDMLDRYNSIEPSILSRGLYLAQRLKELKEALAFHESEFDAARDKIRNLEDNRGHDADTAHADDESYNTCHWNACYRWGRDLIDRLSWKLPRLDNPELVGMISTIKAKRIRRELTFEHYVHVLGILNAEMHRRTGAVNFRSKRNQMAKLWKKHNLADRENTEPYFQDDEVLFDPSQRQYGETRITESELLAGIDLRTAASRITARHDVSFDEAITMLTAESN